MKLQFLVGLQKLVLFAYMMYSCKHFNNIFKEKGKNHLTRVRLNSTFMHTFMGRKKDFKKVTFNTFLKILMNETAYNQTQAQFQVSCIFIRWPIVVLQTLNKDQQFVSIWYFFKKISTALKLILSSLQDLRILRFLKRRKILHSNLFNA